MIILTLECGHTRSLLTSLSSEDTSEPRWCIRCADYKVVTKCNEEKKVNKKK
jgi:hypothetical protein